MRYLGAILAALLLFTACKDDPMGPELFDPYYVGSFYFSTPDSATYVGKKGKRDSVIIDEIGDFSLALVKDSMRANTFVMSFIDSTFSQVEDSISNSTVDCLAKLSNYKNSDKYSLGNLVYGIGESNTLVKRNITYNACSSIESEPTDIEIIFTVRNEPDNVIKHYTIKTDSMETAISDLVCD